ncbi:MAG: carboxypeptidase-like regulatory domain-containing protein [Candidatus Heimdallarchaeaceae archaeon]
MPVDSHLVRGRVYDIYGVALEGATVILTHVPSNETITQTTDTKGDYIINLSSLSSWSVGDSLSIAANKTGEGTKTETTTVSTGAAQTQNLTLAEEETVEGTASFNNSRAIINKSILVGYDKRDINRSNRLPVSNEDVFDKYQPSDEDAGGDPSYFGFLDRNGNWYIQQYNVANGTFRYVKGSSNYQTNWTNRTSLSYGHFDQVF